MSTHVNLPARMAALLLAFLGLALAGPPAVSGAERESERGSVVTLVAPAAGTVSRGTPLQVTRRVVVNFEQLAREEARRRAILGVPPVRPLLPEKEEFEEPAEPTMPVTPEALSTPPPFVPFVPSPAPSADFMGLDDIPMVDSSYIVIPPDVHGGVGPSKIMESFNNNYRIRDKATGATQLTLGTATFWDPVITDNSLLLQLTDPRTLYDPVNNRWIVEMQTVNSSGHVVFGVSQTSDPSGNWYLYDINTGVRLDFPTMGVNKNWIGIAINRYSSIGSFQRGIILLADYPAARAGTLTGVTTITHASGTHFCSAPCITYSATQESLWVVTHLSSASATYSVDVVTGTPSSPVYTNGGTLTRTGGGWVQPSGSIQPQSAPNAGSSVCGATPCKIETQDSQVRSEPVYRDGHLWYAQTVGLPSSGLTHTGVQWTKIRPGNGATATFVDGGRLEDPSATATNGGPWYAFPHVAVNSLGDFIVGFTRFSSAEHPAAGYAVHFASEGAGTLRDAYLYKGGEDYYHKDFGAGRNRWGDFSKAQVDPSDDVSLWVLDEYAKNRVNTDDGTTGSNGSRWSSWWAKVITVQTFTITASAGAGGSISPSGGVTVPAGANQSFTITPANCYHVADVLVDGVSVGAVTNYTFTSVQANHTISASFAANGPYTITASAGSGGSISPSGGVGVACGANQSFTITPDACYHVADVLVDGVSVGAVTNYSFNNVQAGHTISASFAANGPYTITASAGSGGSISPSGGVQVACGADQSFTITPNACYHVADVLVDGVSVGAVTNHTFNNVQAGHTISASFAVNGPYTITASAGSGGSISPSGGVGVACGANQGFTITPNSCYSITDVVVDGSSAGAVSDYSFSDVQANHTISATFTLNGPYTITASAGAGGSISPSGGVGVACGASQTFDVTPDACYHIVDVVVDGGSVGAVATYTFTDVQGNHTIDATFAASGPFTISASAGSGGSISPSGDQSVACGASAQFTIAPDACFAIADVLVDGSSVGAVTEYTFSDVQAGHTIAASFADTPPTATVLAPNGGEVLTVGTTYSLTWSASDCAGVTSVDLLLSRDGVAGPYETIALGVPNTGSYDWVVTPPPTNSGPDPVNSAYLKVVAHDGAANDGEDVSDAAFAIFEAPVATPQSLFFAVSVAGGVELRWRIDQPDYFTVLTVERADAAAGPWAAIPAETHVVNGLTVVTDGTALEGRVYFYRLIGTTRAGERVELAALEAKGGERITATELTRVVPNPSRGVTRVDFALAADGQTRVSVVDVQGREVALLADGTYPIGRYSVTWNGRAAHGDAAPGVYFVRYNAAGVRQVRRLVVLP